ncbi:MAG: preprotein translocase subunit SecA [bacterium]|nr:preprotein translocase subunit SecA [bacterium]
MWKFLNHLFDENEKTLKKYHLIVEQINDWESSIKALSDQKLAEQTNKFKAIIKQELDNGKSEKEVLDSILPEAFATVREVSRRTLGLRHFDVQLLAGIGLHNGKITEQKTGEGKTLTVTCPLYLNALLEKGVHLVTVNDYLAEVGAGWMGAIYSFLGLKTGVIIHDQAKMYDPSVQGEDRGDERLEHFVPITRQQAYLCDILYGTNNEFGFDYLRDNMVPDLKMMVQRTDTPHFYAIVDEADSILIDEARTPLIISAPDSEPTDKYLKFAAMVTSLAKDTDFTLDEKAKTATLTDLGVKRIEQKLGVKNLYEENFETIHYMENALRAQTLYQRDKEYIVRDNQVIIVDEHTGRLMYGRRYGNGLHQAIEAKERVKIQQESRTLATISLQNYFRLYHKIAGMTGTAATEAEEFRKIYKMDVLVVPTNKPVKRQDRSDIVYKTAAAKYSALVKEVEEIHATGQPILIGTRSIYHNQLISDLMRKKGIAHEVLNAKNNEKEAFIIARAGAEGAITVATNIAGRGVDVVLGGAKPEIKDFRLEESERKKADARKSAKKADANLWSSLNLPPSIKPEHYDLKAYQKALQEWQKQNEIVVQAGGLAILGTERHESRRIDNQLRGRAGRQGDPGSSRFYIALEDEIMRIFGGEQVAKLMDFLKIPESQPIEANMVSKTIEASQTKVEGFFFDQRQRLVEFDDVMNKQREIIYRQRRKFLELSTRDLAETTVNEAKEAEQTLSSEILGYLDEAVAQIVQAAFVQNQAGIEATDLSATAQTKKIIHDLLKIIPFDPQSQQNLEKQLQKVNTDQEKTIAELQALLRKTYQAREEAVGQEIAREIEKQVMLSTIDELWMDHLDAIEDLRQGIWMRGDKNTVLAEYRQEAFTLFEKLMQAIRQNVVERIFKVQINPEVMLQRQEELARRQEAMQLNGTSDTTADLSSAAETKMEKAKPAPAARHDAGSLAAALAKQAERKPITANNVENIKRTAKVGRNDPCPCGSGKKYKKCCGANQ